MKRILFGYVPPLIWALGFVCQVQAQVCAESFQKFHERGSVYRSYIVSHSAEERVIVEKVSSRHNDWVDDLVCATPEGGVGANSILKQCSRPFSWDIGFGFLLNQKDSSTQTEGLLYRFDIAGPQVEAKMECE